MKPGEHKSVQVRILAYAEAIGWTIVPREEAEQRRGFDPDIPPADRAKNRSLFFDDMLDAKLKSFCAIPQQRGTSAHHLLRVAFGDNSPHYRNLAKTYEGLRVAWQRRRLSSHA